jgi:very-short-patch-repair endonuclease
MCKELKLIIEVGGYSHNFKTVEDHERDKELSYLGFTVLRFTDEEGMKGLSNVVRTIETFIADSQV